MNQLEKPDADPPQAGDYPADLVPPRCSFGCNAESKPAARICIYWMTWTPSGKRRRFPTYQQVSTTSGYAKARWVYMDQWGCYVPPPTDIPGAQRGIADYHWAYDTDVPFSLTMAWAEAKSGLATAGAPPAGTIQPFGDWLQTMNVWASPAPL